MSFATPHLLWALLLIPALILLRLLLPRRRRIETAMLSVWRAAAERVPKARRVAPAGSDILLGVLLLAVALLTLAGAGLQIDGTTSVVPTVTVLLDRSPSMGAVEPDGRRRFEHGTDASAALAALLPPERVKDAYVPPLQYAAASSINEGPVAEAPCSRASLQLRADESARRGPIVVVTDQPLTDGPDLTVVRVGSPRSNLAVAAFAAAGGEVFVRIDHHATDERPRSCRMVVYGGKGPEPAVRSAARALDLNGRNTSAVFPFDLEGLTWLACRILPPEREDGPLDALAWDDTAWLSRRWSNRIAVCLIGQPSKWLRRALADDPRVSWAEQTGSAPAAPPTADLLIANEASAGAEARWALEIVGGGRAVPAGARLTVSEADSPLMMDVTLSEVRIARHADLIAPAEATVLATLDGKPAITQRSVGDRTVVRIGFSLEQTNTNWVTDRSFPVFLSRLLEQAGKDRPTGFSSEFGSVPVVSVPAAAASLGSVDEVVLMGDPTRRAVRVPLPMHRVGCWFLSAGGRRLPVAAWRPSPEESNLSEAAGGSFDAAAYVASLPTHRTGIVTPLWPWLLGAAVLVLAVGWGWLRR